MGKRRGKRWGPGRRYREVGEHGEDQQGSPWSGSESRKESTSPDVRISEDFTDICGLVFFFEVFVHYS